MTEKFNEATPQRPGGDRPLDASLVTIDLPSFIEQIRLEPPYKNSDRNAITVFKTNGLCIVLIALHSGAEMITHTTDDVISLQVLEGHIRFNTDEQSVELGKEQMIALHGGIPHSVLARKEAIFLLTLTTPTGL